VLLNLEKVVSNALSSKHIIVCIRSGWIPWGIFRTTTGKFTGLYNISKMGLEAHVVVLVNL
jgi:hypothetical protein